MHQLYARVAVSAAFAFFILMLALILGPRLAEKIRLPSMVGLVLAGMLVGPHGVKILDTDKIALPALGEFGLLYLMFSAGLELDMKLFARVKKAAIVFAVLSFVVPFSLGIGSARWLAYAWPAAILMGSNWGSHTLVTYPILRKMGLARNRAVATVVGATAVTDTSALLVLTAVSVSVKKAGGLAGETIEIVVGLAALAGWTLFVLPRIGRWFFGRVGTDRSYRFVFGMVALLSGAVIAEAASIDGIVGAFFAGIGMNRVIPERSPLMERVQFFGTSLFIPIFLVSVGILLEPKVLIDPKTLEIAAVFTVAVLGGKALAAVIAGRAFKYTWPEVGVMSGLSGSQAAATLATTLIGAKLGIFDKSTINAVLVVILVSLVATPAMVTYFAKRVKREPTATEAIGNVVLALVRDEQSRPLLSLAGRLAASDNGIVVAAGFATHEASDAALTTQRELVQKAETWLADEGREARSVCRVAETLAAGLFETVRGEGASLMAGELETEGRFLEVTAEAEQMVADSPVPLVLAYRFDSSRSSAVVILARHDDLSRPVRLDLDLALEVAARLGHGHPIVYVGPSDGIVFPRNVEHVESDDAFAWATANATKSDLLVFPGLKAARAAEHRIGQITGRMFLVTMAAHGIVRAREGAGGLVVGRSAAEQTEHAPLRF